MTTLSERGMHISDLPLVSIVTPSLNQAPFLEETILSVLGQDYSNLEYIVIDGGSTDGSVDIIRKYECWLAYWVSEPDRGQTHALIKGFAQARGTLLSWLCADDVLEASMVRISVDYHRRHPDVGLTYGDRLRIDAKGNVYGVQRYPGFRPWYLAWGFGIPQETTLFGRQVYEAVGGLDEGLQMAMDFDLWCKISRKAETRHIPAYLGRFRAHATNKSTIFTREVERSAFAEGFPAEHARVYQRHFCRQPSLARRRLGKPIWQFFALVERRTRRYRRELAAVERVRLA